MKSHTWARTLLAGTLLVFAAGSAWAGVATTKHNLGTSGVSTNQTNSYDGTDEICVFCHTPHGASTSAAAPLWNRALTGSTFTTYDSLGTSTLDGDVLSVGSVSIACLSCHDGTQAMNVMINTPGSGTAALTGNWTGPASTASPVGSLNYTTASIVEIGTDLTDDHPVGIEYAGGGCGAQTTTCTPASGDTNDRDFNIATETAASSTIWFVDRNGTGGRQKDDIILYTRDFTGGAGVGPSVECASCHDPHESTNNTFLRVTPTGSAICLACHIK